MKEKLLKNSRIIYVLVLILLFAKILYLNKDKISETLTSLKYQIISNNYKIITKYEGFSDIKEGVLFLGSVDCPHCVNNIEKIEKILSKEETAYYFKVDFDNPDNIRELDKFKKKYKFKTIPHIIILSNEKQRSYSSSDIARLN